MKKIQKNAARFDNLKQDFLDDKKYSGTAEATLNGYRYDITRFLKFLSDKQLAVNEAGFKRYVIHLTDSGMTANSVNHYIRSVKVFLYWCMEQDEIAPFKIKMVKEQETIKDVYTQEELCALIQPPKRKDSFVIWRSWAIINFILGTAAREATVCEMQMQDVSFDDRTITFRHLKNKHVQLLPMSEALASCLKKYRLGHLYRSLAVSFSEPTPLQQAVQTYIHLLFCVAKGLLGNSKPFQICTVPAQAARWNR